MTNPDLEPVDPDPNGDLARENQRLARVAAADAHHELTTRLIEWLTHNGADNGSVTVVRSQDLSTILGFSYAGKPYSLGVNATP